MAKTILKPIPTPEHMSEEVFRPLAVYRRLMRYTVPHWRVFLIAATGMAASAGTTVAFMGLVKPLLDGTFIQRDPTVIQWMPWAIVGLFLLRGASDFASSYGMAWIARRVVQRLRGELFDHLLRMPVRFYDRISSGQLISRLTYHVEQVAEAATNAFTSIVKDGLTVIGLLVWMFVLNWRLAVFCLIVAPVITLVIRYVSRRFRRVSSRQQANVAMITQASEEMVNGQRVIKTYNGEPHESRVFAQVNERARRLSMKMTATRSGSEAAIQVIAAVAVALIVHYATQPDVLNSMTPGAFVSFMGAMLSLMNPLRSLTQVNEKLQRGISAATDVFKLMSELPEPDEGGREIERAQGLIEYQQVRFRYRPELPEALRGVSVTIRPGQTVAFVGRSGSGKSTLLALLPRFYEVDSGAIRLDGIDIREYRKRSLRAQIALVDQQVRLFNATIAENIAYGMEPLPPDEQIIEAARAAHAWEFIEKYERGIHTEIGQNGVMLSGGQRQRIAIARALLKNAPILILDEATSALDTESERLIQAALDRLVKGRTTLVIAHRLSTIQNADLIVVMQDGQILEQGSHDQLLSRGGAYATLYHMQFEESAAVADA
jgi:subfamily B ATP-binding cassette protein MsbA